MTRAAWLLSIAALLLGGCLDIDFDPPSIVMTKRILAITSDLPESFPGEDVRFDVLAVDENGGNLLEQPGVTYEWSVCVSLAEIFGAAGLGSSVELSDTCDEGGPDRVVLETEGLPLGQAELDGNIILGLATAIMGMGGGGGMELPPGVSQEQIDTLLAVITIVGVPLRAEILIFEDGVRIARGLKRFAITTRDDPTTRPPPPRFSIADQFVSARDGEGDGPGPCVPESGETPRVEAGAEIVLSPDDEEEPWLEDYPVFNLTGELQTSSENAFYNWFSTDGEFSREVTQRGDHDTVWTSPETPGTYPLWVVVRDGHLGTTWCRAEVIISN